MSARKLRNISASEAILFGLRLLAQVTAILLVATGAGWLFDLAAGTAPLGLAAGAGLGALAATLAVVLTASKELKS